MKRIIAAIIGAWLAACAVQALPAAASLRGDIDGDGTVSVEDAQLILMYYVRNTLTGIPTDWDSLVEIYESIEKPN